MWLHCKSARDMCLPASLPLVWGGDCKTQILTLNCQRTVGIDYLISFLVVIFCLNISLSVSVISADFLVQPGQARLE